ncbi:MAG TPA: site-specific DNA-methyltransferase [Chthoniobacterales bacterium]
MDGAPQTLELQERREAPFHAATGSANPNKNAAPDAEKAGSGRSGRSPDFQAEGVTLYLADCLDVLPLEADAVVSDPPYGMDWDPKTTRFSGGNNPGQRSAGRNDRSKVLNDDRAFDPSPWLEYPAVVLFGCNHYGQRLPVGTTLVWLKRLDGGFGSFLSDAELAWMKGGVGVYAKRDLSMNGETATRMHPTQKPVALMAWCMDRAKVKAGATVLDPYMGSGSTGIACIRTGRRFIGIERDEKHFANAVQRIRAELAQGSLFRAGGGGAEQAGDDEGESRNRAGSPSRDYPERKSG